MNDTSLAEHLATKAAEIDFSGAVRVRRGDQLVTEFSSGHADRANERPNRLTTRFGIASGTKGFTALTVMALVAAGEFELTTRVNEVLPLDLPIDDRVTIDQLLMHRSGIGDYLDEEALGDIDEYVLGDVPAHALTNPLAYAELLQARPQRDEPGATFRYNNGAYVVLSIVVEACTGSFHDATGEHVFQPAGMTDSGFFRADDLPADCALGYLADGRTNVMHLPVIGAGDGGAAVTLDDMDRFWSALRGGAILPTAIVDQMLTPTTVRADAPSYGRGFWMDAAGDHVWLEGMDAGVSFQSGRVTSSDLTYTIVSNTSAGAWPLVERLPVTMR